MQFFHLLFAGLASLLAVVEASDALGYEVVMLYSAYKTDFLVNGNARTLGKQCGLGGIGGDTAKLGTFNDFASCLRDNRSPGQQKGKYNGGPAGNTINPITEDVAPNVKIWGFDSWNPGALVAEWGGSKVIDDIRQGDMIEKTMGIVAAAKQKNSAKVLAVDLDRMKTAMDKEIQLRRKEWREEAAPFIQKTQVPKWEKAASLPKGAIKINTIPEPVPGSTTGEVYQVLNSSDPVTVTGANAEKKAEVVALFKNYMDTKGTATEGRKWAIIEKATVARQRLELEICA